MALPKRRDHNVDLAVPTGVSTWASLYEVENPGDVAGYVKQHPTAVAVRAEAPHEITAVFGNFQRQCYR